MEKIHYLLGLILLLMAGYAVDVNAQVSNDNEDGVNKIARPEAKDFVPGQVLFKLKDGNQAQVRRAAGHVQSAGISSLDAVLKEYGVQEMEQLLPNAKVKGTPRRSKAFNGEIVVERDLTQLYKVTLSEEKSDETLQMIEKLKNLPEVEFAEPNYKVYIMGQVANPEVSAAPALQATSHHAYSTEATGEKICDDPGKNPLYAQQGGIKKLKVNELWNEKIINPKRPVIAILDTGVDITHPDLADNIWTNQKEAEGEANYDNDGNGFKGDVHGWDFINNTANIRDYNSHGTHVAGIAAAADNEIGIVGANPQALIMPITVMQSDGTGDVATIAKGVSYAIDNGATIINMSFGAYTNSNVLRTALAKAYQSAVLVAAAGNDNLGIYEECGGAIGGAFFPAAYEFVFGVMATEEDGSLACFSNVDCDGPTFSQPYKDMWGDKGYGGVNYELKAPGVDIISAVPNGNYKRLSGTSMSAPLVAGAISALQMIKEYDTQEILWGDIIHTPDFHKAYEVNERPAILELISLDWDDSQDGGNGDNMFDAGETLRLYPLFKTTWGEAKNIKFNLAVAAYDDETLVDILSQNVDFGWTLSNYGRQISKNPLLIKIADNVADNRHIRLILTATCDNNLQDISYEFPIIVNNVVKIGGIISEDLTLTADKNYLVTKNLVVDKGCTLTVEPGTTIKFMSNVGLKNVGTLVMNGEPGKMITLTRADQQSYWNCPEGRVQYLSSYTGYEFLDTLSYCRIEYTDWPRDINLKNCILMHTRDNSGESPKPSYYRSDFTEIDKISFQFQDSKFDKMNIVNNHIGVLPIWGKFGDSNYFNNLGTMTDPCTKQKPEWLYTGNGVGLYHSDTPSYLGTSNIEIANSMMQDIDYGYGYSDVDLSNMLKIPVKEAHGIVWKILVDGYDAQDEYEKMSPLGVGRHKFEVYFNRPMNKEKVPYVSFGIREPYTQNSISEDGTWNSEGTIYTAYHTITGKTHSNGLNLIYVTDAEDDEHFEIPYEKSRFYINVQSAGSMATGFAAEAGLGRVNLTWNNDNNDFDDAMGFNIYRYTIDAEGKADTICINKEIVDIETTEYSDYDVKPGETYYYLYRVLSTDLKEYDVSNVVAATPLTSELGDANGSGDVDVNDVITTVNYAAGMDPKPFIFEAADMNTDQMIDILDVIGIIQKILNPSAAPAMASVEAAATYTIEDGMLYVDSPVALAGVQVQINLDGKHKKEDVRVAGDLDGFEHASAWLSDNDYLFLAFNMNGKVLPAGKHALLKLGDADLSNIVLSDAQGHNVLAIAGNTTGIDAMGSKVMQQDGVFNLKGQKVAGKASDLQTLPKGVYIVNGEKVVK